jgi:hypothetical protein
MEQKEQRHNWNINFWQYGYVGVKSIRCKAIIQIVVL